MPRMWRACASVAKNARQQVVDGDVVPHGLARDAADKTDQAGARAIGQTQLGVRRLALRDTMLTMRPKRRSTMPSTTRPDHVDGTEHHGVQGGDPVLVRPVAEVSGQRPVGVDQDVRMRAGGDGRVASGRLRQVGRDPAHANAGFARDLGGGLFQLGIARRVVTDTPSRASCCAQARLARLPPNTSAVLPLIPRSMLSPCRSMPHRLSGLLHGRLSAAEANQYRSAPRRRRGIFLIFAASSADLAKAFQPESPKMKVCPHRDRSHVRRPNCLPRSAHAVRVGSNRADERGPRCCATWPPASPAPMASCRACPTRCAPAVPNPTCGTSPADPHGAFTIAYLVWRQGAVQSRAWPQDLVHLPGFAGRAVRNPLPLGRGGIRRHCLRRSHAPAGRHRHGHAEHQIHRLGNASPEVAISLHIYGVDQADICSGVNHLIDKVLDASPRR